MGLTKQEIAQKVDERSYTVTEDIYGEIYGNIDTLGDDEVYVVFIILIIIMHVHVYLCKDLEL